MASIESQLIKMITPSIEKQIEADMKKGMGKLLTELMQDGNDDELVVSIHFTKTEFEKKYLSQQFESIHHMSMIANYEDYIQSGKIGPNLLHFFLYFFGKSKNEFKSIVFNRKTQTFTEN